MAVYESLEQQDFERTIVTERAGAHSLQVLKSGSLAEYMRLVLVGLLLVVWTVGAYAGIVYWSIQGSLGGVILSVIVPGFGAASTLPLYLGLGSGG